MKADEALLSTARTVAGEFSAAGKPLDQSKTIDALAKKVWERHRDLTKRGHARVSTTNWKNVHPSWKGRYLKAARQGITSLNQ